MKYKYNQLNRNEYEVHQLVLGLINDGSRVLDIGCATGCLDKELVKKKCEVWGIDRNSEAVKKASRYCHETFSLNVDKGSSLPVPEKYFDYVIILDVIEHLLHPENILSAIKPHIKGGGKIILSTPNVAHASIRLMLLKGEFQYTSLGIMDNTHVHLYTRTTFGNLLKKEDFRISKMIPTNGMCKVPFLYKITDRLPRSWQYRIAQTIPTLFSYQFVAEARLDQALGPKSTEKIKFLLINAIDVTKTLQTSLPPLSLGYLVSSLRCEYGDDLIEFKIIDRDIASEIRKFKPDIVGITSVSQNYNFAIKYASIAKKHALPVLIGGTHVSVLPTTLTKNMDIAVIGEGEATIKELFAVFLKNKKFPKMDLRHIKGLAFWDHGKIIQTEKRPPIEPMDAIPMPARDLMKIEKCTHVFSSRGCPYRCVFCASSRFWNKTRFFSAKYVVAEVKYLYQNFGVKEIDFWDDLFIVSRARIKEMISLLRREKLLGKIVFGCAVRSNLIDENLAKLLQTMNVKRVSMGLESGTPRILNYLKGSTINIKDHQRAIRIFKKYGIEPSASFIIGSPTETREEVLQTLKFIKDSKLRGFGDYVLTPLPGTPIWDYAKERGLVSEKMDWSTLNVEFEENHQDAVILSETLSRDELYKLFLQFRLEQKKRHLVDVIKHPIIVPRMIYHYLKKVISSPDYNMLNGANRDHHHRPRG